MTAEIVIFRATDTGDNEASLADTEKIEFNDPDKLPRTPTGAQSTA